MLNGKSFLSGYSCSLSFLFGSAVGCVTALLCSGDAIFQLYEQVRLWQLGSGLAAFLVPYAFLALLFLLLSAAAYGYLLIPLLNTVYGFCAALECSVLLRSNALPKGLFLSVPIALAVIPTLRISVQCAALSLRFARLLRSNGVSGFDYHPFARSIWLALILLFILFLLRCWFFSSFL